jgi:hypothetical protein
MTKKLKELLNMNDNDDLTENESIEEVESVPLDMPIVKSKEDVLADASHIMNSLTNSEKFDAALSTVNGLDEHDLEMDDIAAKALNTYKDLCDLGLNVTDAHSGKIYEVSAQMLKIALDAKDAKVSKKLKMLDLQLKKMKVDKTPDESGNSSKGGSGQEFDRNELLKHFSSLAKKDDSTD